MQPDFSKLEPVTEQPDFAKLKPVEASQPVGGFQRFAQSVAKPALKLVASVRSIEDIARAGSVPEIEEAKKREYDFGYLGRVSGLQSAREAVGVGAELGSYAGGGGVRQVISTGLKSKVLSGAVQGARLGIGSGSAMSFGQALQEAETQPSEIAVKTLLGGVVGGAGGLALGAITPVVAKAGNVAKRFTNVEQINTELENLNTQVFKPKPTELEKWSKQGKNPMKTYTEIFGTDVPLVGKDNRFTRESISDAVQRVDDIYKPAAEGFNTILKNSPEVNSLTKAQERAVQNLDAFNLTPDMKEKATKKIAENFESIKREAVKGGKLLGDDSIPVYYSDNLKDRFWSATKNFGTEDASIANAVNSSIGHGFKESIENSIQDLNVKQYNRYLGDLIVLRDFLETKAGASAGTGGKATRLAARLAGTVVGAQGGPLSAIIGNITGDKIAQIIINPAYQPYRWLLSKKLKSLPESKLLKLSQEANEVIETMFKKRMARLALPEPTPLGSARNPIITPSPTTYEAPAEVISPHLSGQTTIPQ